MTAVQKQLAIVLLLVSCCRAQANSNLASVTAVSAARQGEDVRIEIALSGIVTPSVSTAKNPDRLIIDLPNSTPGLKQSTVAVNSGSVRGVRVALHNATPPITRVVVDLKQAQPYVVTPEANRVIVTISPAVEKSRGAPAAAVSGGIGGLFRRRHDQVPSVAQRNDDPVVIPPPSLPPISAPSASAGSAAEASTGAATLHPTAKNPNRGSLQEGTVFPADGSPGSGSVPPAAGGAASFGTATAAKLQNADVKAQPSASVFEKSSTTSENASRKSGALVATEATPNGSAQPSSTTSPMAAPASQSQSSPHSSQASAGQAAAASNTSASQSAQLAPAPDAIQPVTPAIDAASAAPVIDTGSPAPSTADTGPELTLRSLDPNLRTVFKVKYVAEGVAYLDGGKSSGLQEGMKLEIKDTDLPAEQGTTVDPADPRVTAELQISAVAETSAVTEIHSPKRPVKPGDLAYLSSGDAQALVQQRTLSATRKYPAVVTFTEGDPLEEEARAEVPRPPLPSVNRARGRIGVDYMGTVSHGLTGLNSSDAGLVLRTDITRINGTFWNLSGY